MVNEKKDKSDWAIGGSLLIGLGAGFFFVKDNPYAFVACLLLGLGSGLIITAIISRKK